MTDEFDVMCRAIDVQAELLRSLEPKQAMKLTKTVEVLLERSANVIVYEGVSRVRWGDDHTVSVVIPDGRGKQNVTTFVLRNLTWIKESNVD